MMPFPDPNAHGLVVRCVYIPRHQNGFGFTLRHFIVYPPENYVNEGSSGQQRTTSLGAVTEPVDTIFVKSVRENGPAARAGLCVGDRVVSVNGETIAGKSYDQVVHLIQLSPSTLCLEVTPKQYDTLQLFYEEKAYRPETNQRPYQQQQQHQYQHHHQNPTTIAYSGSGSVCIPVKHTPVASENYNYFHNFHQQLPPNQVYSVNQNVRNFVEQQHHHHQRHYPYQYNNHHYEDPSRYQGSYNSSYESVFLPDSSSLSTVAVGNMSAPPTGFHGQATPEQAQSQQQHNNSQKQTPLFSHLPRPTPYKSTAVWSHLSSQQQFQQLQQQQQQQQQQQLQQQQQQQQLQQQKYYQKSQHQSYYPFNQRGHSSAPNTSSNNASGAKSHESILAASAVEEGSNNRYGSMECLSSCGAAGSGHDQSMATAASTWKNTPGYRYSISTGGGTDLDFRRDSTISLPPGAQSGYKMTPASSSSSSGGKVPLREMTGYSLDGDNMMDSSCSSGYEVKMVDRIRRSCEQKEEFLKRPNQPLMWITPNSSAAAGFPKELYAQPKKFQSVPWPPPNVAGGAVGSGIQLQQSASTPAANIGQTNQMTRAASADSNRTKGYADGESVGGSNSWNYADYGSAKNRLTVVGSGKLHCDPPPDWKPPAVVVSGSSNEALGNLLSNNNNNNGSGGNPSNDETEYFAQNRNEALHAHTPVVMSPSNKSMIQSVPVPPALNLRQQLTLLPDKFKKANNPPLAKRRTRNSCTPPLNDSSKCDRNTLEEPCLDNDVILRKREIDPENDNDRLVRRVSYLKATSSPIDMDRKSSSPSSPTKSCATENGDDDDDVMVVLNLRKSTTPVSTTSNPSRRRSVANKLSSDFLHKGRIVRLKQFFEERTQPSSLFKFHYSPSTEFRHFGSYRSEKSPDDTEVIKDGPIHFKVRAGENKKGGYYRSWRQGWAQIRRSGCLYLSKEKLTRDSISSLEDNGAIICVGLKDGISIEPAADYATKRKNVLRLKTSSPSSSSTTTTSASTSSTSGSNPGPSVTLLTSPTSENRDPSVLLAQVEILIQADDPNDTAAWLKALQQQQDNNNYYAKNNTTTAATTSSSSSNGGASTTTTTEFSPKSSSIFKSISSGFHSVTTTTTPSTNHHHLSVSANVTNPTSPKTKTWKGKVAKQLKKHMHIGASPSTQPGYSAQAIPEGGATFGVHLEECPPGESNPNVPRVMEICVNTIESRGLTMVGIYRIPGNSAAVTALTDSLNKGNEPNAELDPRWNDVHVISSMLKSFLRNLPDPLLTSERYADFIRGVSDAEENVQFDRVKALIDDLPEINYETLRYLILHLKRISENSEKNRMESKNLSIVFGPTLVRPAEDSVVSMVNDMKQQCRLVELLINHAYDFFPPREPEQNASSTVNASGSQPVQVSPTTSPVTVIPDPVAKFESDIRTSLIQAAQRKVSRQQLQPPAVPHHAYGLPAVAPPPAKSAVDESGHIRSYASLGAETEQRVRQFEMETRAMLTRDGRSPNPTGNPAGFNFNKAVSKSAQISAPKSEEEVLRLGKMKVEAELRKAKDDLENEDFYDQLADNPSSIVHHREYGLPSFPFLSHNVSSSSVSSSNSAGGTTVDGSDVTMISPNTNTSTWPIKLGPTPFKPFQQTQALPPKPPNVNVGTSKVLKPITSGHIALISNPLRKVNSVEQLTVPKIQAYVATEFDNTKVAGKETLARLKKPSEVQPASPYDSKICGSLDSLRDIVNGGSREDVSLRSSNGSDLVVTLSRELDQKMESLRPKQTEEVEEEVEEEKRNGQLDKTAKDDLLKESVVTRTNGIPKGRSKSMIDHRSSDVDKAIVDGIANGLKNSYQDPSLHRTNNSNNCRSSSPAGDRGDGNVEEDSTLSPESQHGIHFYRRRQSPASVTKEAKTAQNRLTQSASAENKKMRRHSLSGTADVLRLAFDRENMNNRPYLTVSPTSGKSNDTLATALPANNILESHV